MGMKPKPMQKPTVIKAPLVEVMAMDRQDVTFTIKSQGSVSPRTETNLVAEVAGVVTMVSDKFKVGGYFKKGELLLAIDDINYKVAHIQAKARLNSAKAALTEEEARAQQARDEWRLSGKPEEEAPVLALRIPQLQRAKADVQAAEADLQAAEVKLARTKILAPYDAMIKMKNVDIGQYVSTGTKLAETFAVDYAEIRLPIKQRDAQYINLPRIHQSDKYVSNVDLFYDLSGTTYQWRSKLSRYEGVVDNNSRVHYVVALIDDPYAIEDVTQHDEIRIGTFVNATIYGKTLDGVITIPRSAVYGANKVFLLDDSYKLSEFTVDVVRADDVNLYTTQDFPSGYRLVTTKLETPVPGMTLRVKGETDSTPVDQENSEQDTEEGIAAVSAEEG